MLSKNVNKKKCAPKLIFFNEKKIEKDSDNFWHRKLTLKVKFWHFLTLFDTSPLTQFSKFNIFLWVCWCLGKNLSNFVPPVWKVHNPYCHIPHRLNMWYPNCPVFKLSLVILPTWSLQILLELQKKKLSAFFSKWLFNFSISSKFWWKSTSFVWKLYE